MGSGFSQMHPPQGLLWVSFVHLLCVAFLHPHCSPLLCSWASLNMTYPSTLAVCLSKWLQTHHHTSHHDILKFGGQSGTVKQKGIYWKDISIETKRHTINTAEWSELGRGREWSKEVKMNQSKLKSERGYTCTWDNNVAWTEEYDSFNPLCLKNTNAGWGESLNSDELPWFSDNLGWENRQWAQPKSHWEVRLAT